MTDEEERDPLFQAGPADQPAKAQEENATTENNDAADHRGSEPSKPQASKPRFGPMRQYFEAGYDLVPLQGKVPLKGWRERNYTRNQIEKHVSEGGNAGVRLKATDLVIDVDPRNFDADDKPLLRLAADFQLDTDRIPVVWTGGGGQHLYAKKPAEVRIINGLAAYRGIEFKSFGRQVVAPGSVHPETGGLYEFDPFAIVQLAQAPDAPSKLLTAIQRPPSHGGAGGGELTPAQLALLLSGLDPEAFDSNDKWFPIMAAAHHATAGAGLDEFVAWSTSDMSYREHAQMIAQRWQSLNQAPSQKAITVATIYKALSDAGQGKLIEEATRIAAEDDFADAPPPDWPVPLVYKDKIAARHSRFFLKQRPWPLICVNEEFFSFQNSQWRKIADDDVRAELRRTDPTDELDVPHLQKVVQGIKDLQNQDAQPFTWLRKGWDEGRWPRREHEPAPASVVAFSNGLLDTKSMELMPPTPHYFTVAYTGYAFDEKAECPKWRRFLSDVLPDGGEAILQEWFGYNLVGDTRHHKFLVLVGAKRGGKGTIGRVLEALVGKDNVAAPDLAGLGANFGLWPLTLTKTAIIGDAHDVTNANRSHVLSRLKAITGGDAVQIDRKHLSIYSATLPTRFTLMANKVPKFADDSGALATRMIVIRFQKSFLGKEDPDLTEKLKAELPGIANWALDGLRRLQVQGRFTETEASREESEEIALQQSHVRRFMAESLDLSDDQAWTPFKRIYSAYTSWAAAEGVRFLEDQSGLWTNIRAVTPHLERVQRRYKAPEETKAKQCYGLLGAKLLEPDEQGEF